MELIKPGTNIDFLGRRKLFYTISLTAIAVSIGSLATVGLNFGIDFTGGSEIQVSFHEDVGAGAVREAVAASGFGNPEVQEFNAPGSGPNHVHYLVRIREQVTLIDEAKAAAVKTAVEGKADTLGKLL